MLVAAVAAKVDPVGVWKPGIKHGTKLTAKETEDVQRAKAMVDGGSFKINKNKTFGMALAGEVMLGTWSLKGDVLSIKVIEIIGMSKESVAKLPASRRSGSFRLLKDGIQMVTLPEPKSASTPRVMWRKMKAEKS